MNSFEIRRQRNILDLVRLASKQPENLEEIQNHVSFLLEEGLYPVAPKEITVNIPSDDEKVLRLNAWKKIFEKLPRCFLEKWPGGYAEENGFLDGSVEEDFDGFYWNSTFVILTRAEKFCNHGEGYCGLYFCFLENGKFKIEGDGNYEDVEVEDKVAEVLTKYMPYKEEVTRDSWAEGLDLIIKIIEEAYADDIPDLPRVVFSHEKPIRSFPELEKGRAPLDTHIIDIDFPARVQNILHATGIKYLGEILCMNKADFLKLPRMGKRTYLDLISEIENLGYELGMTLEGYIPLSE